MSTPFSIATNKNVQSLDDLEEIYLAYNERRAAVHQAPRQWNGTAWSDGSGALAEGMDCQKHEFVVEIQDWIEDNCGKFMPPGTTDYDNTNLSDFKRISELAADATGAPLPWQYFCETVVGGNLDLDGSYGWRRSTIAGSFDDISNNPLRGQAQTGDYLSWEVSSVYYDIWQDIRLALTNLKVTELPGGSGYDNAITINSGTLRTVLDPYSTIAAARAAYPLDTSSVTAEPYAKTLQQYPAGTYGYFMWSQAAAVNYYLYDSGPGNMYDLVSSIPIYLETEQQAGQWEEYAQPVIEDKLAEVGTVTPTADGAGVSDEFLEVEDGDDFDTFGGYPNAYGWKATSGTPWRGIVVWNFTNSD